MKSKINQIEMKNGYAFLEFSNPHHRFDIIVTYEEYIELGKPTPGDLVEISLKVQGSTKT